MDYFSKALRAPRAGGPLLRLLHGLLLANACVLAAGVVSLIFRSELSAVEVGVTLTYAALIVGTAALLSSLIKLPDPRHGRSDARSLRLGAS